MISREPTWLVSQGPARHTQSEVAVPEYSKGMVLTCTHEECNCRIVIQEECHCPGVTPDSTYVCACGTPLLPLEEPAAK